MAQCAPYWWPRHYNMFQYCEGKMLYVIRRLWRSLWIIACCCFYSCVRHSTRGWRAWWLGYTRACRHCPGHQAFSMWWYEPYVYKWNTGYTTSSLVHIMAWHRTGAKPLPEPVITLTHSFYSDSIWYIWVVKWKLSRYHVYSRVSLVISDKPTLEPMVIRFTVAYCLTWLQ